MQVSFFKSALFDERNLHKNPIFQQKHNSLNYIPNIIFSTNDLSLIDMKFNE